MTKRVGQGLVALSFVSVLFAIGSAAMPTDAHAGVFSDVLSVFGKAVEASSDDAASSGNVQTMALAAPATNIDPNPSIGGGDITVIDSSAVLAADGPNGTSADIVAPESHQISTYVVREGDTLSGIAQMFNVSVNTIRWSNDISKSGTIVPGQKLTILPISGISYTVKKGDTLASIAKAYGGDVNEIANFNSLDVSAALSAGATIIIPNGELASAPAASSKSSAGSSSSKSNRVVLNNGTVIYEPAHDTDGPSYPGYYAAPLSHYIETQGLHGYNAVDLAAPSGTPIKAAAGGTVIISRAGGWNGGYGTYVVISHGNGTQTLYAHMSKDAVAVGDYVSQGEVIGYVGMTGEATGPHLHFEVRGAQNPFAK
ncbi:MAG TPA: peptidoglycan DD-metalloendopeptidase family protein [Candidatus Paceibacterota bacterium]|nr:peptidoglycan DD-metalloendopeptidase family protein [Candidatus Paceibacterota bacterium]